MIRLGFIGLMVGIVATPAFAIEALTLDVESSKIAFVGAKPEGKHAGGFKVFEATGPIDMESPETSSLKIVIDTTSLWSDNASLTNHLKNPDFFDVRKHPKIIFKSTRIQHGDEEGKAVIAGTMTMLGKEVDVEVPVTTDVTESGIRLVADFTIERSKWGMNYGQGKIKDAVAITASLVFKR